MTNSEATEAVLEMLEDAGIEVVMDTQEMAAVLEANEQLQEMKKSALESTSALQGEHHPAVTSSSDTAKLLNSLRKLAKEYEEKDIKRTDNFIKNVAISLNMPPTGRRSQYGTFETKNGKIVTIRLSDHNSSVSNYDNAGVRDGISIIITSAPNKGITNDGEAHVTEIYYNAIKLRKADGKPLAEIIRSIEQALYSGEYKDTTGLAEVEEVNPMQFLKTERGEVYGFVKNGKIYLDPKLLNPNTPIHEYTHIWDMALQKSNPELWARGVELMKQTPLWDEVKNNPAYADIAEDENLIASEVHARLTGKEGAALLERLNEEAKKEKDFFKLARKISLVENLRRWIRDAWKWIKDTMTPWTKEEADAVSLEEFVNMPIADLARGKKFGNSDNLEAVNARFNEELKRYEDGVMGKNEMFHLGTPYGAMKLFLPNLPIVMRQSIIKKGTQKKHNVDLSALLNMPEMLSSPIFIFQRDKNTIGILTEMKDREGKNVCVAIELNKTIQDGGEFLEVNDIRSFHGREVEYVVEPIIKKGQSEK